MVTEKINVGFEIKTCDEEGIFCGYASVFDVVDHQREEVAPGAFERTLSRWESRSQMPKMLWQHDPKAPIGVWQEIREDGYGLFVKGRLLLDLRQGREAYSLLKSRVIDGLSIGFNTLQAVKNPQANSRILQEIDLHEISLVTFAANPKAKIMSIKAVMGRCAEIDQVLGRMHNLTLLLTEN